MATTGGLSAPAEGSAQDHSRLPVTPLNAVSGPLHAEMNATPCRLRPRQFSERLMVVVLVDQGQLQLPIAALPGRQAQRDAQPGVARAGDHDLTAASRSGCFHEVIHR